MKGLLFASRVAFILNLLFIVSVLARMRLFTIDNQYIVGFVVTAGLVLAVIVNAILNTILSVRVLRGKKNTDIPAWLINTNFIILAFQLIFFFIS
jgi:hypothetical protein